jgi:hypothetical protein
MKGKEDKPIGPECPTRGCDGRMVDITPIEKARSDQFVLIRIECPKCQARAWRILRNEDH